MSPIESACIYMCVFIMGVIVGAMIHAISSGLQQAAYEYRVMKQAEIIATEILLDQEEDDQDE